MAKYHMGLEYHEDETEKHDITAVSGAAWMENPEPYKEDSL